MTEQQGLLKPQNSSSVSCERTKKNKEVFLTKMSPSYQTEICHDARLCIMGDYPTLAELNVAYGRRTAKTWLIIQLHDLSEYCGVKEKLTGKPLEECAYVIATDFFYLKVSELMLFFHRFKSGKYGKFYGSVDPLVICRSLRDFIGERNNALDHYENEERRQKLEDERKHAVSWQEYCIMTDQFERINTPILPPL